MLQRETLSKKPTTTREKNQKRKIKVKVEIIIQSSHPLQGAHPHERRWRHKPKGQPAEPGYANHLNVHQYGTYTYLECYSALNYGNSVIYITQRNLKGCYVKGNKPSTDEQTACTPTSIWNVKGLTWSSRECRVRMVVMSRGKCRSMI